MAELDRRDWQELLQQLHKIQGSIDTLTAATRAGLVPPTASGSYTPALSAVANVAASTAYACQWFRVGDLVTVSGRVDVDPTAAAPTQTQLGLSLPVASGFTADTQCGGVAAGNDQLQVGAIYADATNDRAELSFMAQVLTNEAFWFTFTYTVV